MISWGRDARAELNTAMPTLPAMPELPRRLLDIIERLPPSHQGEFLIAYAAASDKPLFVARTVQALEHELGGRLLNLDEPTEFDDLDAIGDE